MRLLALLLVLLVATPAAAESPPPSPADKPKSEMLALAATAVGTLVAGKLAMRIVQGDADTGPEAYLSLAGIMAFPSLGHVYAEDWTWAGIGVGSRLAGFGVFAIGLRMDKTIPGCNADFDDGCSRTDRAKQLMTVGLLTIAASTVVELFHAPYSAHRYNQRHAITVTPTVMPGGGGGFAVAGSF
jgi:hypothetical protein